MQIADTSGLSHETNHFPLGSCTTNAPVEFGGYNHDFIPSRNPIVPQSLHGTSNQSVRGVRTSYSQRSTPTSRASSSNSRLGHPTTDEGLQLVAENYSSRHSRPFSTVGWRNSDRNGRSRISNERFRSLSDEAGVRERLASEVCYLSYRNFTYCATVERLVQPLYDDWTEAMIVTISCL